MSLPSITIKMACLASTLVLLMKSPSVTAFSTPSFQLGRQNGLSRHVNKGPNVRALHMASQFEEKSDRLEKLESVLLSKESSILSEGTAPATHRRGFDVKLVLPDSSGIVLASSMVAPTRSQDYSGQESMPSVASFRDAAEEEEDYLTEDSTTAAVQPEDGTRRRARQPVKKESMRILGFRMTKPPSLPGLIEDKNYNGIITNYFIPIGLLTYGAFYGTRVFAKKYAVKVEKTLDLYANEMVYHDGDFEEMEMCKTDYQRKLSSIGAVLNQKDQMLKKYLEVYAKKKAVTPQAISSLSHVFSMYKLSEEKAAKILCDVACNNMKDKMASCGKLLFFGRRILQSAEAKEALLPIKETLIANYRAGGESIVENSQRSIGEAAYRAGVASAGKNQTTLTAGWEVLGLTEETAQTIWDEVCEEGFKSKREQLYGGSRQKFDDKGRKVDDTGKIQDINEAKKAEDEEKNGGGDSPSGGANVYECEGCGFTLFPAKGREFKFFPDSFVCPECGAAKDKFKKTS